MPRLILSLLLLLLPFAVSLRGQSYVAQIDSILDSPRDTSQIWLINDLLSEASNSGEIISDSLFSRIFVAAHKEMDSWALALIYFNRGAYELNTGKMDRGLAYAEAAIRYAKESKQDDLLADANSLRLEFIISIDDAETAIAEALKLAHEYREAGNLYYASDTYQILSAHCASLKDIELTMEYDSLAIALARESEYIGILITGLANAADNLNIFNRPVEAIKLAEEAVVLADEYELPYVGGNALIARAISHTALGNYAAALEDYERLVNWQGDQEFPWLSIHKGVLLQRLGRQQEARELLDHSVKVIKNTTNDFTELKKAYQALQTLSLNEQQYDSIARYRKLIATVEDSLQSEAKNRSLLDLREQYKTLEKETEIELQKAKLSSQRLLIYLAGGALLIVSLAVVVLYVLRLRLKRRNAENEQLIAVKETLIGEIHHRVKNNLQVISSLLQLQATSLDTDDEKGKAALQESQSRVSAMGLIHKKLYQGTKVTSVHMPDYLEDLGSTLLQAYRLDEQVDVFYDVSDIWLDVDVAISLGLIVNELIANSLKYAFPDGREGLIEVALHHEGDNFQLTVIDNGVGASAAKTRKDSTAYGTNLIQLLTKKLKGKLQILKGSGYGVEVSFPG